MFKLKKLIEIIEINWNYIDDYVEIIDDLIEIIDDFVEIFGNFVEIINFIEIIEIINDEII